MRSISKAASTSTCENSSIHLNFTRLYTRITYSMVYKTIPRFWVTVEFGLIPQNLTHILDLKKTLILRCISIGITMRKKWTNEGKKVQQTAPYDLGVVRFCVIQLYYICMRLPPQKLSNPLYTAKFYSISLLYFHRTSMYWSPLWLLHPLSTNRKFGKQLLRVLPLERCFFLFLFLAFPLHTRMFRNRPLRIRLFFKFRTYSYIIWW